MFAAVGAILRCGSLLGATMGRAIAVATSPKHGIKRVDRLLGNPRLHGELDRLYGALAKILMPPVARPVLLVDWTDLNFTHCALTAALALHGRAVTVYAQVYPLRQLNSCAAHRAFLHGLARVLGPRVCPIIIADAGFQTTFMELVLSHGWDYVCRVRGRKYIGDQASSWWMQVKSFYKLARATPRDEPDAMISTTKGLFSTRLVLADLRSARAKKTPKRRGRQIHAIKAGKRAHEPWLLATSLSDCSARRVLALYGLRMQIEAGYRDIKCGRLGWGLKHTRIRLATHLAVLLLLASIAAAVALVVGLAAEQAGLDKRFQANTERNRRVLSLPRLGLMLLQSPMAPCLDIQGSLEELRQIVALITEQKWGDS